MRLCRLLFFFFFNDPAPTEISPLPLHDALPIWLVAHDEGADGAAADGHHLEGQGLENDLDVAPVQHIGAEDATDRKSTRLNSSHLVISYAVFCLKKKKSIKCDDKARSGSVRHLW